MRSIVVLVSLLLAPLIAFADGTVLSKASQYNCEGVGIAESPVAACNAKASSENHTNSFPNGAVDVYTAELPVTCSLLNGAGEYRCAWRLAQTNNYGNPTYYTPRSGDAKPYGGCPENSSSSGAGTGTCTCAAGFKPDLAGESCAPFSAKCEAEKGKALAANYTAAWLKSPHAQPVDAPSNVVGDWVPYVSGGDLCVAGCQRRADEYVQGMASLEPAANGLYRFSVDVITIGRGTSCTSSGGPLDKAFDPAAPIPPCAGFVGSVNGKATCVPKVGGPPLPLPSNGASAPPPGVPVDGGNPSAGDKPTAGPGSGAGGIGRTPLVGDGGNGGGPSSAAGPLGGSGSTGGPGAGAGTGTGTSEQPKPKDPCGLPGTPACKLDESGTPTFKDFDRSKLDGLVAADAAKRSEVAGSITAPEFGWVGAPPVASCEPFDFPDGKGGNAKLDPCGPMNVMRDVMGYLWAIFGAWWSLGVIRRSLAGGG